MKITEDELLDMTENSVKNTYTFHQLIEVKFFILKT